MDTKECWGKSQVKGVLSLAEKILTQEILYELLFVVLWVWIGMVMGIMHGMRGYYWGQQCGVCFSFGTMLQRLILYPGAKGMNKYIKVQEIRIVSPITLVRLRIPHWFSIEIPIPD